MLESNHSNLEFDRLERFTMISKDFEQNADSAYEQNVAKNSYETFSTFRQVLTRTFVRPHH